MNNRSTKEPISPGQSDELQSVELIVADIWKECRLNDGGQFGDPPKVLFIFKCTEANWEKCYCHKEIVSSWEFDGLSYFVHDPAIEKPDNARNGMYWDKGIITYCFDKENGKAILNYFLGPRYGRGYLYSISQKGKYILFPENGVLRLIS